MLRYRRNIIDIILEVYIVAKEIFENIEIEVVVAQDIVTVSDGITTPNHNWNNNNNNNG